MNRNGYRKSESSEPERAVEGVGIRRTYLTKNFAIMKKMVGSAVGDDHLRSPWQLSARQSGNTLGITAQLGKG